MRVLFFGGFCIIFFVISISVISIFILAVVKGIAQWNKNNSSPRLMVNATVVAKRTNVFHDHHANDGDVTGAHGYHITASTIYYATFQVESGDRMELRLNCSEYGMLAEGDYGKLSFQGTRYLGFERKR